MDHVHMVRRGWAHETLMVMAEDDFRFWLDAQDTYDRAVAEAEEKAIENAKRK